MPGEIREPETNGLTQRKGAEKQSSALSEEKLLAVNAKANTLSALLDPRRHTDHKFFGLGYLIVFFFSLYMILFDFEEFESRFLYVCLVPLFGCGVTIAALRNFHFLPKKNENPGMFASGRTFSYAFVQENLWFQLVLGITLLTGHPHSNNFIDCPIQVAVLFMLFYMREFVPKTSYVSWEQGNEKVNAKKSSQFWLWFVNAQVKIVRWNYVLKKTLLFYMIIAINLEWLFDEPLGTFGNATDRACFYLLTLDAMHNVTTAFFLQTLKFKGFISAELFSFLFNVSPICGVFVTYTLFRSHTFLMPLWIGVMIDLFTNLYLVYPRKTWSHVLKNRIQVTVKGICTVVGSYLVYTSRYAQTA